MNKFKVGDRITGIDGNCYHYTDVNSICEVISLTPTWGVFDTDEEADIQVRIVSQKRIEWTVGMEFAVNSLLFMLVEPIVVRKAEDILSEWI